MGKLADQLTEDQRKDFEKVFNKFDKNESGYIERSEMKNLLDSFGFSYLTSDDLAAILARVDEDLSGLVSKEEFMEFAAGQLSMLLDKECCESIFDMINTDHDGGIEIHEFINAVHCVNPKVTDAEARKIFKKADKDNKGTLEREEFQEALASNECSIWREMGISLVTIAVIREVVEQYSRLAKDPAAGFGTLSPLPYGKANAKKMGYNTEQFPDIVWESSCQCANVFDLVENKGEFLGATVVEFGCGAGADLCVSASLVGDKGRVIGIDMNRPMVKKAAENILQCDYPNIASAHIGIFDGPTLPHPLKPGMADFLIVNGTINLSPRKLCAFKNAQRVLKKGGRLLMADVVLKDESKAPPIGRGAWCDCVAGALSLDRAIELLRNVGFKNITHVGYSEYLTSENTPTATLVAYNGGVKGSFSCGIL